MSFDPEAVRNFEHARWQRAAGVYGTTFASATRPFIEPLLDAAHVGRATRLLDIACGPGFVATAARLRGANAYGVDFSTAMLEVARSREPAVRFDQGDAEALPYADGEFDAVVSNFGIHHVPRPQLALREAHRVLRAGGHVAFSFWAEPSENIAWKLVFDAVARHGDAAASEAPPPGGGFRGAAQCADALRDAGFTDCTTRAVRATWLQPDAAALIGALRSGTARMAAMIEAQPPSALAAILADIETNAAIYRGSSGLALPIAVVIAGGSKV